MPNTTGEDSEDHDDEVDITTHPGDGDYSTSGYQHTEDQDLANEWDLSVPLGKGCVHGIVPIEGTTFKMIATSSSHSRLIMSTPPALPTTSLPQGTVTYYVITAMQKGPAYDVAQGAPDHTGIVEHVIDLNDEKHADELCDDIAFNTSSIRIMKWLVMHRSLQGCLPTRA